MDKYDEQIERLMKTDNEVDRDQVVEEWGDAIGLFQYASCDGLMSMNGEGPYAGCLTMIRNVNLKVVMDSKGVNENLTSEIRSDERIPLSLRDIKTKEQLEVFAEWQRRLDKEIRGKNTLELELKND